MPQHRIVWVSSKEWAGEVHLERLARIWSDSVLSGVSGALEREGAPCLLVGGCVRDLLLERDSKDLDLVVECSAAELLALKSRLADLVSASPVVLDAGRGILRLAFADHQELDLVALQGEDLWSDLARRDLTINAMAIRADGSLADPFEGLRHLEQRRLHRVREGNFLADPLRAVRLLRFAAQLDFEVECRTFDEAKDALDELGRAAGERLSVELRKLFFSARPPALKLLQKSCLERALDVEVGEAQWELMFGLSRTRPLGWPLGLALWLGERSASPEVADRLKLSRWDFRWLAAWWEACRFVARARQWNLTGIFELSLVAGPAFERFAEVLQAPEFSAPMDFKTRCRVLTESERRGAINWTTPPWNGDLVARKLSREPGPWLKKTLAELAKVWASGQARDIDEGLSLLGGS